MRFGRGGCGRKGGLGVGVQGKGLEEGRRRGVKERGGS